jgi:hypothetical protein
MHEYTFTCPACSGHTWGTEFGTDPERARGYCSNCDYTWLRSRDDELFPRLNESTFIFPRPRLVVIEDSREQALTEVILDAAQELLQLNPGSTLLTLTRENGFILTMRIQRVRHTIPGPPPEKEPA